MSAAAPTPVVSPFIATIAVKDHGNGHKVIAAAIKASPPSPDAAG